MNACGIICEYNPFHNGHRYHIQKARELSGCDVLVCVMSGNAVQRGEMAITDKWKRAEAAIQNGCDLVVELPYPFVVQRADRFAHGGVQVLKQAGISSLVFGSESNNLSHLMEMKQSLLTMPQIKGISYAKALQEHLKERLSSNDMLAIFYLNELEGASIIPYTIQRTNAYHGLDITQEVASASAIRHAFYKNKAIDHMTCMSAYDFRPCTWNDYYPYLQTFLLSASKDYLSSLFLMDEGIESLFQKQAAHCMDFTSFMEGCMSARYTRSSIQRTLMHVLTQTTKKEINALPEPDYLRVLAYNTTGQSYLRCLQKQGANIASTFTKIPEPYRSLELKLANAFTYPLSVEDRKIQMQRELLPAVRIQR